MMWSNMIVDPPGPPWWGLGDPTFVRNAFKHELLSTAVFEKDTQGQVRVRGILKEVLRAVLPDGSSRAVWFLRDGERWDRYQTVQNHLSHRSVSCLASFTCAAAPVRLQGSWYRFVHMEWIPGDELFDWLHARATAGDGRAISSVAEKWRLAIKDLGRANIAHGDLNHRNVLITPSGDVKLVDYDTMCVPKLVGLRNEELGVEPYQHPERNGNTQLSLAIDNFSSAFIYLGLKALSAEPRLWQDFVVQPEYDKILFRKEDFVDPGRSALFGRLWKSPDGDVQRLATRLCELWRVPIDEVPSLDELLLPSGEA